METAGLIVVGCAGGLLPDILRIIKNRHNSELPTYFRVPTFWLGLVSLVVLGGFAVWISGAAHPREALIIGFTAPEVISNLAARGPSSVDQAYLKRADLEQGAKDTRRFKLRKWWA